jgi:hypothetical protein
MEKRTGSCYVGLWGFNYAPQRIVSVMRRVGLDSRVLAGKCKPFFIFDLV